MAKTTVKKPKSSTATTRSSAAASAASNNRVRLTREGYDKLQAELEQLRTEGRAEVADRIREAKSHGDISESAQYEAAKMDQAFLEGRIRTLESQINNADIIGPAKKSGVITIGSQVDVTDGAGKKRTFTLVDPAEASSAQGRISVQAPVGKALLGHKSGDKVKVKAPSGLIEYVVISVE